jgi:hypothetical protein
MLVGAWHYQGSKSFLHHGFVEWWLARHHATHAPANPQVTRWFESYEFPMFWLAEKTLSFRKIAIANACIWGLVTGGALCCLMELSIRALKRGLRWFFP